MIMPDRENYAADFFSHWSPEMTYVLGYFCADGCMFVNPRGAKYIAFYSTDRELIVKIRELLGSHNKITVRKRSNPKWNDLFALQIGSKKIYSDLVSLGLQTNKARRLSLPDIPDAYVRHFVRGYFDGDGCISYGYYKRKNRNKTSQSVMVRFASCSKNFLENLSRNVSLVAGIGRGGISKNSSGYHLVYAKNDSSKLFNFMYNNVSSKQYLKRKHTKFQEAVNAIGAVA